MHSDLLDEARSAYPMYFSFSAYFESSDPSKSKPGLFEHQLIVGLSRSTIHVTFRCAERFAHPLLTTNRS
jgi:hypothetical protein